MRHVIPVNISSDGDVFGGMLKKKNCIEAGIYIVTMLLFFKIALFMVPVIPKMVVGTIVILFPGVFILIGVGDQSMFEWILLKLRYSRNEDIIPYEIQTENVEEVPTDIIERYKWKKEKKKKRKQEKKEQKKRLSEFDKKNNPKKKKASKKAKKKEKRSDRKKAKKEEKKAKKKKRR